MSTGSATFSQPRAVWAVAFACVISFMGIGLVDPILPAISSQLHATPSQVSLLFTSYLVVTAVAMIFVGAVSSRIGAKKTLITGLAVIVVFAALAGASGGISGIVGFRAGWGLGNALFIATSLAVIVASATGGFNGAIILYEAALGLGIAAGPLVGGFLGGISWRGPFFGVSVLMLIALVATATLVPATPVPTQRTSALAPLRALRHRSLLTMGLAALCYNWGFFTLLGYAPYPMHLDAHRLGLVFFAWGLLVAAFSVLVAPRLQARFGTARTMYAVFAALAVVLAAVDAGPASAAVERPVASSAYGFLRFIGGGLAPFVAGQLAERSSLHVPFYVGAASFLVAIAVLSSAHRILGAAERGEQGAAGQPTGSPAPVLAAVDAGPASAAVVEAAVRTAREQGRGLELVHVLRTAVVEEVAEDAETPAQADAALARQLEHLAAAGVDARGTVLHVTGDHTAVGRAIAEHARAAGAALVVMGASAHSGLDVLDVLAEGSATAALERDAGTRVLVVDAARA